MSRNSDHKKSTNSILTVDALSFLFSGSLGCANLRWPIRVFGFHTTPKRSVGFDQGILTALVILMLLVGRLDFYRRDYPDFPMDAQVSHLIRLRILRVNLIFFSFLFIVFVFSISLLHIITLPPARAPCVIFDSVAILRVETLFIPSLPSLHMLHSAHLMEHRVRGFHPLFSRFWLCSVLPCSQRSFPITVVSSYFSCHWSFSASSLL